MMNISRNNAAINIDLSKMLAAEFGVIQRNAPVGAAFCRPPLTDTSVFLNLKEKKYDYQTHA
jgi:hypothetical protein